jgi:NAD-dependent dihydropyrimidine dehydrogenase PreA subunit
MPHVITSLCLRDGGCKDVCPVEAIVPGKPESEWPWYYIDPDACIDCGACVSECPFEAIFPEDEVPEALAAKDGQRLSRPDGTEVYDGVDHYKAPVHLEHTRVLKAGETVDLRPDIPMNAKFFKEGPGYSAK